MTINSFQKKKLLIGMTINSWNYFDPPKKLFQLLSYTTSGRAPIGRGFSPDFNRNARLEQKLSCFARLSPISIETPDFTKNRFQTPDFDQKHAYYTL